MIIGTQKYLLNEQMHELGLVRDTVKTYWLGDSSCKRTVRGTLAHISMGPVKV